MTIGERIKSAREESGMTQAELGKKVGVSGVAIMRYEKNQRQPRFETLQRIAAALEVHTSQLLVNFPPELAETLDYAENRGEKLVISNKTDLAQSIEESIRLTYEPSPQERINLALTHLSKDSLEVAAERMEELTEIPRYRRQNGPETASEDAEKPPQET